MGLRPSIDGLLHEGMYPDGWAVGRVQVDLPGGGPAQLALRADVPACDDQRVTLMLDEEELVARAVPEGTVDLRVPIPASPGPRHVTVAWDRAVELSDDDPRLVSAHIQYLDLVPLRSPAALRIPDGLAVWGGSQRGIDDDGWTGRATTLSLAGGGAATLGVRGTVPETLERQELRIELDGREILEQTLAGGPFAVAVPVPATENDREIELSWAATAQAAPDDDREVAARLTFVGVAPGDPPTAVAADLRALADPRLRYEGVYPDGWLARTAVLELSQPEHAELVVKARTPVMAEQALEIRVDDNVVHRGDVEAGFVALRFPAPGDPAVRRVELRWRTAEQLLTGDERDVAAHLAFVGFVTPRPPVQVTSETDIGDPQLEADGLHEDYWLAPEAWLTLAAGPAATLVLRAQLDRPREQSVEVFVNGAHVGAAAARDDLVQLRAPLAASDRARHVRLVWRESFTLSLGDPRRVSARLVRLALEAEQRGLRRRLRGRG